jgi:predicted peptidase
MWLVVLVPLLGGCATRVFEPAAARGFVELSDGGERFWVYLPADWSSDRTWPVVLFLHGGSERGADNRAQTQVGLGPVVARSNGAFPAIVVFPQCPSGAFWAQPNQEARALKILDLVVERYRGDRDRLYMTGPSLGGFGTWIIAARNPGKFAALVPICGGVMPPRGVPIPKDAPSFARATDPFGAVAERIGQTPVWTFQGADDWVLGATQSRRLVAAMQARGGRVRYTEYPGVGHNSWDRAYAEPELWPWLLSQRKGGEGGAAAAIEGAAPAQAR